MGGHPIPVGAIEMPVRQGQTQLGPILEVGNKGQVTLGDSAHRLRNRATTTPRAEGCDTLRCAGRAYIGRPGDEKNTKREGHTYQYSRALSANLPGSVPKQPPRTQARIKRAPSPLRLLSVRSEFLSIVDCL